MNTGASWLVEAAAHLGQREVPGPGWSPWIKSWWLALKGGAWWVKTYPDDSILPWCGAFVAGCLARVGLPYAAQYASARAWMTWGVACGPLRGAVCVLSRNGGGHVGFLAARSADGSFVQLLGGNQGDAVTHAWFPVERVLGYRKPAGWVLDLTPVRAVGTKSQSEA